MTKRKTPEDAALIMSAANFTPLEEYPGAGRAWKCRCEVCKSVVTPRLSTVQMGVGCASCAGLAKISPEEARAIFESANLQPIGKYRNSRAKWQAICKICNATVSPSVSYVKKNKSGCKYCSNKKL